MHSTYFTAWKNSGHALTDWTNAKKALFLKIQNMKIIKKDNVK